MADAPQSDPVAGLVDIPLPAPVSLWPQTWPARVLVAVIAVGLVVGCWQLVRWWIRNRYRREALAELARVERMIQVTTSAELSAALASLIRRTALAAFPREQIAALAGPAWLSFLDRTANTDDFTGGVGRTLEIGAYQPESSSTPALLGAVRHWIKAHHA